MKLVISLFLSFMGISHVFADYYCGSSIVHNGMSYQEVIKLCGQPTVIKNCPQYASVLSQSGNYINIDSGVSIIKMIYNFGPSVFMEKVTFNVDKVVSASQTMGYGFTKAVPDKFTNQLCN